MGSPLDPLFANSYMAHIGNEVVTNLKSTIVPIIYLRYVDDIFLMVPKAQTLRTLKESFELNSVLKFTHEIESNRKLAFLDCMVTKGSGKLATAIYTKDTSSGESLRFHSFVTQPYKNKVFRTLLNHAYKICSDWPSIDKEIIRLKQVFTNNNYAMALVDR